MKAREQEIEAAAEIVRLRAALQAAEERYDALVAGRVAAKHHAPATRTVHPKVAVKSDDRIPDLILERINGQPTKTFKADDFTDLTDGDTRPIFTALTRLSKPTKRMGPRIAKVGRGDFKALSKQAVPSPANGAAHRGAQTDGATAGSKVLDFMQEHPGAWFNTRAVVKGMGLPEKSMGGVQASLGRLAVKGLIEKVRGDFRFGGERKAVQQT